MVPGEGRDWAWSHVQRDRQVPRGTRQPFGRGPAPRIRTRTPLRAAVLMRSREHPTRIHSGTHCRWLGPRLGVDRGGPAYLMVNFERKQPEPTLSNGR